MKPDPTSKALDAIERTITMCDVLAGLVAMRNLAAHQYEDLEPSRVWRTVTRDVPALRTYLVEVVRPRL